MARQKANLILAARRTESMERLAQQLRERDRVNVVVEGIDLSSSGAGAELKSRPDKRKYHQPQLVDSFIPSLRS
jgi:uncharacterized protein